MICDECHQEYDKRIGDPMDRLCRPCSSKLYGYHPKTGHDHRVPRRDPWAGMPQEMTIKISQMCCEVNPIWSGVCGKGTAGCNYKHTQTELESKVWYAHLTGNYYIDGKYHEYDSMTHGFSPAHAAYMAYDLMSIEYDECSVQDMKDEDPTPHCYCQDVTNSWPDSHEVSHYVKCCRCTFQVHAREFSKECEKCGGDPDDHCCEACPTFDTFEYWEAQGRRLREPDPSST